MKPRGRRLPFKVWASPTYKASRVRSFRTRKKAEDYAQALADSRRDLKVYLYGPGVGKDWKGEPAAGSREVKPWDRAEA